MPAAPVKYKYRAEDRIRHVQFKFIVKGHSHGRRYLPGFYRIDGDVFLLRRYIQVHTPAADIRNGEPAVRSRGYCNGLYDRIAFGFSEDDVF